MVTLFTYKTTVMPHSYVPRRYRGNRQLLHKDLSTAAKALMVANSVKKLVNVEYKSHKATINSSPDTSAGIGSITGIAQGDDFNSRDGRKIRLKSLRLKGSLAINASATASSVRVLVFRDNNGSTTVPTVTDIFPSAASFTNNLNRNDDPQSNSRFTVLYDRYFNMTKDNNNRITVPDRYIPLDMHVYFTGTGTGDEGKGNLFIITGSNEATNKPVLQLDIIIKFIDN